VAQPGSALRSGRRGPQFKSGHPDKHGGNQVSPMNPLLLASAMRPLVSPPAGRSPAPAAGGALSVDDQAAGCSCIASRCRKTVTVTNEIARAAAATPTPHQTPLMLSSQPIARSIENRPGPIAASAIATVASTSGNSRPPLLFQKPLDQCTVQMALNITTAIASDASGVTNPAASSRPL